LRKELDTDRKLRGAVRLLKAHDMIEGSTQVAVCHRGNESYTRSIHLRASHPAEDAVAEEIKDRRRADEPEPQRLRASRWWRKHSNEMNGNRKKAAQELGISDRTLYRRIKQYGLDQ
jgi:DNA-binding NtrC family response regulator